MMSHRQCPASSTPRASAVVRSPCVYRVVVLAVALTSVAVTALAADPLIGVASVVDGDTIEIHGQRIRLHGIDAPESSQPCTRPGGEVWPCGRHAANALADEIGRATVHCGPLGQDRYRRTIAVCRKGGEDLGQWMVARGWAVAFRRYSLDYVAAEDRAYAARRGVWSGDFQMPWDWRSSRVGR